MKNYKELNPELHKSLKVKKEYSAKAGDNLHIVDVFPNEFRKLFHRCPIVLTKDQNTGKFLFAALLGFEPGENLFLTDRGWDGDAVPLNIQRQPFGFKFATNEDGTPHKAVLCIDEASPKLSLECGEVLFDSGRPAEYLQQMQKVITHVVQGAQIASELIAKLTQYDLIEPLNLTLSFVDGSDCQLRGLCTISETKLARLPADSVVDLHQAGLLSEIHYAIASLVQLGALVQRKNQRLR